MILNFTKMPRGRRFRRALVEREWENIKDGQRRRVEAEDAQRAEQETREVRERNGDTDERIEIERDSRQSHHKNVDHILRKESNRM